MALNFVNTRAEITEFTRRLLDEYVSRGIDPFLAPVAEEIARHVLAGDIVLMDNGLAPTFPGAARICLMIIKETDPAEHQGWLVAQAFGPTGTLRPDGFGQTHMGMLRWLTQQGAAGRFNAKGLTPTTPIGFRDSQMPLQAGARSLFVAGVQRTAKGVYWTTFAAAEAQGATNNVAAVPA